jgi:5-methylcytosine-specific restriction endonuclease McrA
MSAQYNGGAWIRKEKRLAIYIRDGFKCLCCGTDLRNAKPRGIALDHIVCKVNGGTNEASNLVTICITCNSKRGAKQWTKFYPPGSHARVRRNLRRKLNLALAKDLIENDYAF